jgi:hypothetical protein
MIFRTFFIQFLYFKLRLNEHEKIILFLELINYAIQIQFDIVEELSKINKLSSELEIVVECNKKCEGKDVKKLII